MSETRMTVSKAIARLMVGTGALLLVMGAFAGVKPTPDQKCEAAKLKLVGKKAGCELGIAANPKKGNDFSKCTTSYATAFPKVKGTCSGDQTGLETQVDAFRTEIAAALTPNTSKCQAGKIKAAGKMQTCELLAAAKAVLLAGTADFTKCKATFATACMKLEAAKKEDCTTTGDAAAIEANVDAFTGAVLAAITTTTTALPIASGAAGDGAISAAGQIDSWTFTATAGGNIVVSLAKLTGDNTFFPQMVLYGPDGAQLAGSQTEIARKAASSGTFTVRVSAAIYGNGVSGTGTYRLYLATVPGAFVVPDGDDGGPLTNGGNHDGTLPLGDLDLWRFAANAGDSIIVGIGTLTDDGNGFGPRIRLYGPDGALLPQGASGTEVAVKAASSGTFTVLVSAAIVGNGNRGTGTYRLYFAKVPGAFVVPSGDDGGILVPAGQYDGTIDLGIWTCGVSRPMQETTSACASTRRPISLSTGLIRGSGSTVRTAHCSPSNTVRRSPKSPRRRPAAAPSPS